MLEQALAERRREMTVDALIKLGLGGGFCFLVFGALFLLFWFLLAFAAGLDLDRPGLWAALACGILVAAALWSALRRINPYSNLEPLSEEEKTQRVMERAASRIQGEAHLAVKRDSIAAYASILIDGPRLLVEGLRLWRGRPAPALDALESARSTLEGLESPASIDQQDPEAVSLLLDLDLIRVEGRLTRESPETLFEIRPTAKGRRLRERA